MTSQQATELAVLVLVVGGEQEFHAGAL
jgi:hypothetical protein